MAHRWDLVAPPVTGLVVRSGSTPRARTGRREVSPALRRGDARRRVGSCRRTSATTWSSSGSWRRTRERADRAVVTGWASLRLQRGGFFDGSAGWLTRSRPDRCQRRAAGRAPGILLECATIVPDGRSRSDPRHQVRENRAGALRRGTPARQRLRGSAWSPSTWPARLSLTSIRRMRRYRWARYWYRDIRRSTDRCPRRRARQVPTRGRLPPHLGAGRRLGHTRCATARCTT